MTISAEKISSPPAEAEVVKEFRFRREDLERIKAAAASVGLDESEFILQACLSCAQEIEEREGNESVSVLSPEAYAKFRAAVESPGKFVPGLARAAKASEGLLKDADVD